MESYVRPSFVPPTCQRLVSTSTSHPVQISTKLTWILNQDIYYNIILTNGSIVTVYCDMEGINCDEEGGWTRVAYIDMTKSGTTCPSGLTQTGYININHHVRGRSHSSSAGCDSTLFSAYSINYTKVC